MSSSVSSVMSSFVRSSIIVFGSAPTPSNTLRANASPGAATLRTRMHPGRRDLRMHPDRSELRVCRPRPRCAARGLRLGLRTLASDFSAATLVPLPLGPLTVGPPRLGLWRLGGPPRLAPNSHFGRYSASDAARRRSASSSTASMYAILARMRAVEPPDSLWSA